MTITPEDLAALRRLRAIADRYFPADAAPPATSPQAPPPLASGVEQSDPTGLTREGTVRGANRGADGGNGGAEG